ncbi:hypothetical protein SH611_06100 [Geminicoccaceae bacterium 1502E]|nr:hypothetical protein [Geminicoccaceae bacterium 1502E]
MVLHVTNGDEAALAIEAATGAATVLPWRDVLHDGPVPAGLDLERLSAVRAAFLAGELGLDEAQVRADFCRRDTALTAALAGGGPIVLWFEHDLYDQLQLLQVLDLVAGAGGTVAARVRLAQAGDHLAMQPAQTLVGLLAGAVPLAAGQLALARRAWAAFREPGLQACAGLLEHPRELARLPFLGAALRRLMEELPAPGTGLGRTERQILELLAAEPRPPGPLFGAVAALEEARFMGDWSFFQRLRALAAGPVPLIAGIDPAAPLPHQGEAARRLWSACRLTLTRAGREVLAGGCDRLAVQAPRRWQGGTLLEPGAVWRWDPVAGRLLQES